MSNIDLDKTREQLVTDLIKAREHISRLQRQLIDYQSRDIAYPEMMLQSIPDGILLFDKEGYLAEVKPSQDPLLSTLFPIEHLIGHQYTEFFPDDLTEKFSDAVSQARKKPQTLQTFLYEAQSPDGVKVSVEFWVKVFPGGSVACSFRPSQTESQAPEQDVHRQNVFYHNLIEITRQLLENASPSRFWQILTELIHQHMGLYLTRTYLYQSDSESLSLIAGTGDVTISSQSTHLTFSTTSRYPAVRAFKQNQVVLITNPAAETGIPPNILLPGIQFLLEIPIEGVGVLELASEKSQAFDRDEQLMLSSLAQMVRMIWKVLIEKDALEKQKELFFLEKEIKERIQQTKTIDEALQVTLQELSNALGFERAEIRLNINPDRKAASGNE
ncbi:MULTISPECIES: GAF domain-containing protein [Anaerolinea]|uniref:GAF domain-containing protein n=1 Tax=Anaerolinea TaxID=233189 RepID=UPI002615EED4|nr:hypothetical protein [Anaerolinea thermophila]